MGAFYGIREYYSVQKRLSEMQDQLSAAEIKKTNAEAEAKAAGVQARNEALEKYSQQLEKMNSNSADVSKRIQELVRGQLENMKLMENSTKDQLNNLQAQVNEAQQQVREANQQAAEAKQRSAEAGILAMHDEMIKDIAAGSRGFYVEPSLIKRVDQNLGDARMAELVKKDVNNPQIAAAVRIVLLCELFKNTSDQKYRDQIVPLVESNKPTMTPAIGELAIGELRSTAGSSEPRPAWVQWAFDDGFPQAFRNNVMWAHFANSPQNLHFLNQSETNRVAAYLGQSLLQEVMQPYTGCNRVKMELNHLQSISPEAAQVYAWKASSWKIGAQEETDRQCIRTELDRIANGRQPTDDEIKRWPGPEVASVAASN